MTNKEKVIECATSYYNLYNSIPMKMHMAYNFGIQQNLDEVVKVLDILGDRKFNNFVELGSSFGGSLWLYSLLLCNKDANILSIDSHLERGLEHTIKELRKIRPNLNFSKLSSSSGNTSGMPIDLLHIDAGHTYEDVINDFTLWSPCVIKGGVILFHDIVEHIGVMRCFNEISLQFGAEYKVTKITEPPYSCGIGILEKI